MEQSPVREIQQNKWLYRYDYILNTLYLFFYFIYKFIKLFFFFQVYFAILFGADSGAINYITETVFVFCV